MRFVILMFLILASCVCGCAKKHKATAPVDAGADASDAVEAPDASDAD